MSRVVFYALRFRGETVELSPGRFWSESRATLRGEQLDTRLERVAGDEAVCRHELDLRPDGTLATAGELAFGTTGALTFRGAGRLCAALEAGSRHGTVLSEVSGGRGAFAGTSGSIASLFLLSDTGTLTDHHLGLLALGPDSQTEPDPCG
jgi:hypothetical protein